MFPQVSPQFDQLVKPSENWRISHDLPIELLQGAVGLGGDRSAGQLDPAFQLIRQGQGLIFGHFDVM